MHRLHIVLVILSKAHEDQIPDHLKIHHLFECHYIILKRPFNLFPVILRISEKPTFLIGISSAR